MGQGRWPLSHLRRLDASDVAHPQSQYLPCLPHVTLASITVVSTIARFCSSSLSVICALIR